MLKLVTNTIHVAFVVGSVSTVTFSTLEFAKMQLKDVQKIGEMTKTYIAGFCSGAVVSLISTPSNLIRVQLQTSKLGGSRRSKNRRDRVSGPSPACNSSTGTNQPPVNKTNAKFSTATSASILNASEQNTCGSSNNTSQTKTKKGPKFKFSFNTVSLARETWRHFGIGGFYRCFHLQCFVEAVGRGVYFTTYDLAKKSFIKYNNQQNKSQFWRKSTTRTQDEALSLWQRMVAGGASGFIGWLLIYPMDVIKTRMMSQRQYDVIQKMKEVRSSGQEAPKGSPLLYETTLDCIKKSYQNEGPSVFFRGIGITLLRSVPVAVAVLPTYDFCMEFFTKQLDNMNE